MPSNNRMNKIDEELKKEIRNILSYIDAELNEFYSKTNITQYYFNHFNI